MNIEPRSYLSKRILPVSGSLFPKNICLKKIQARTVNSVIGNAIQIPFMPYMPERIYAAKHNAIHPLIIEMRNAMPF